MTQQNETLKTIKEFLEFLGTIGNISIIIGVITFIATEKQRRDAEVYQAWQVITAAYEQTGSGGRIKALEFLNSEPRRSPWFWWKWERESLSGLAAPQADLDDIQLQNANLFKANLQQAYLETANFQGAYLGKANLQQAYLEAANFQGADLWKANLQDADLRSADLQDAVLWGANLQGAYIEQANNLTHKQIKSACNWKAAIHKGQWDNKKETWEALKSENKKVIEELDNEDSSNPEKSN